MAVKVSVVIIGYNAQNELERCLLSVQKQLLKELEIIFVDDGSTDRTLHIAQSYAALDSRISVLHQENKGILAARLAGIRAAAGAYVFCVDSDDRIEEGLLLQLYEIARERNADIVISNRVRIEDSGKVVEKSAYREGFLEGDSFLDAVLMQQIGHNVWGNLYRKTFLESMDLDGLPWICMGEDLVFNVEAACRRPRVWVTDVCGYFYYWNRGDVNRANARRLTEIVQALEAVEQILKNYGRFEKKKDQYHFLYFCHCYYYYVIGSDRTGWRIKKRLADAWKRKKAEGCSNKLCGGFCRKLGAYEKWKLLLYGVNFWLGYGFVQIALFCHDIGSKRLGQNEY